VRELPTNDWEKGSSHWCCNSKRSLAVMRQRNVLHRNGPAASQSERRI
jgi:hypothetical protein